MITEEEQNLTHLIRENTENSFDPFFSARVMSRIKSKVDTEDAFSRALVRIFRRVVLAAIILIVVLATYNISTQQELGNHRSPLEKALALPPVTVEMSITNLDLSDNL